MTARWRRRACALTVVAITATLAWAAGDNMSTLTVTPRMIGIRHQVGSSAQGTVMIANPSPMAFTGRIVGNCGAPPAPRIFGGTGDPLTIAGNTTLPVQVDCPTTLSAGMHRCTFDLQNASNQSVGSFFAFCVTQTQQVLTAAPTPVTFANQQVGVESTPVTLTIANPTGSAVAPMQLQVDNENFLVGSPCQNELGCDAGQLAAGSSASVGVLCKPLATGAHTGKLFLIGSNGIALTAPIDLSCATGSAGGNLPVLTINPPNVLVNAIEIAGATANSTVELANGGSGMIAISSLDIVDNGIAGAANDWAITSLDGQCTTEVCTLGFQQKLNVRLTFDPSAFNNRPAKLVINYSDNQGSKQASVTLDGSGLGATAELVGTPSIELGTIPVNTLGSPQTFRVRNQGNRPTSLHLTASPMAPFLFPMDVPMDPGETTVNVTCMSSTEIDASVTLNLEGSDAPAALTVPMHCDVRETQLTTNPTSITLGEIRMGTTVPARPIAIDRVGAGTPIPLESAALADQDPNLSLGMLSGSATPAMVSLAIDPIEEQAIANAVVVTPAAGDTLSVPVTGSVVHVELDADDVMTLGTFCVGQPTSGTAVGLTSKGTATVVIHDVDLALGADAPFELEKTQPSVYPSSLAPGGEATVLVTPKRTDVADDQVTDTLVWDTDAGPVSSVLTTRFVADGGAVAPDSLDFGDVEIRIVNDDAQGVTLQNCSTDPLQLIAPAVPPPFALTGEFPLFLEPGAKATFSILFLPTEVGEVTKSLTIESLGGDMFEVTLRGNGITGDGGGPGTGDDDILDETSFYACGCRSGTNPSGVLTIAFALLAGGWRRRRAP